MTDGPERLVAEIPPSLKRLVDADERTNREVVESALWREFGGKRLSSLERRLENKRAELRAVEQTLEHDREREDMIHREIKALEEQLGAVESEHDEYERELTDLLESMESGMGLHGPPPVIERLAREWYDSETQTDRVIEDLQNLSDGYDIDDSQWGDLDG